MATSNMNVNGKETTVQADTTTPLLYILRDGLGLHGPKFGCGLGQCGACTVLVDGKATRSCITPASAVEGREVTTLEGLGSKERLHTVQEAFIEEQAAQCGYCINGIIMEAVSLLEQNPKPTESGIREVLKGNLCRCGTHLRIIRAIQRASGQEVTV